jgi:cathepsin B
MRAQRERARKFAKSMPTNQNLKASVNEPLKYSFPTTFDWRTTDAGKRCKPSVLAQESCGACYAFAIAQIFAARYCSVTSGNVVDFSPQDLLACNARTNACNGGILDISANYLEEYGIASLACYPYAEKNTPDTSNVPSQKCSTTCTGTGTMEKKFCKKGTTVMLYGADRIKNEIYLRGPVASSMTVWADLSSYKSGVYKQTTGAKQGGHAIILLGWGTENGANYWLVQNSWGADWGDAGYFKQDMSDTNSAMGEYAVYCVPDV